MDHETWVPSPVMAYVNVDGKLLLHQWWMSTLGKTELRKIPISKIHPGRPAALDTMVYGGNEWGVDGTIRPMSQVIEGD